MTTTDARKRHENTTPKENPMVTIATPPQVIDDLHAIRTEATTATSVLAEIRDLLDERLPSGVDNPGGQANELNNDDPDERIERNRPVDATPLLEREREEQRERAEKAEAERDEWKAKFEQTDNLLSRTRDERDTALTNQKVSAASLAGALNGGHEWRRRHAALWAGIQEQINRDEVAADAWGSGTEHVICTVHASELRRLLDGDEGDQS